MKNRFLGYLFVLFLVAACGSGPPEIDEEVLTENYQWCYTFDFINETYNLSFVSGEQTENGLETTDGVLGVSYTHGSIVQPLYLTATLEIVIPDGTGSRNVVSDFDVFGIEEFLQATIPNTVTTTIAGSPDSAGINGQNASIGITTSADTSVSIRELSIYGNGSSPFSSNDCEDTTPTVTNTPFELPTFTPTFTPTNTFTPVPTNTPTNTPTFTLTPTPTETTDPDWCYRFTDNWSAFTIDYGSPGVNGVEVVDRTYFNSYWRSSRGVFMNITVPSSAGLNYVRMAVTAYEGYLNWGGREYAIDTEPDLSASMPYYGDITGVDGSDNYNHLPDGQVIDNWAIIPESAYTVYFTFTAGFTTHPSSPPPIPNGEGQIDFVELRGNGINPFGASNCNLPPTPTPSNTPIATDTDTPTETFTPTPTETDDGEGGGDPDPSPETLTPTPTSTFATSTVVPSITSIASLTPIATRTPGPTPTFIPTVVPDPGDDTNGFTSDGTCQNYGGSEPGAESSGNWFEWLFGGFDRLINCVVMPPINFIANLATQTVAFVGDIYDTLVVGLQSLWDIINTLMETLWTTITLWAQRIWDEMRRLFALVQVILSFLQVTGQIAVDETLARLTDIYALLVATLAGWVLNFEWFRIQLLGYLIGWISNFWISLMWHLNSLVWGLLDVLLDIIFFGVRLFGQIRLFVMNIIGFIYAGFLTVQVVFGLWNNSPAQKPPGLPDCINDPLNYDICALWYILDNTFFSGIGAFIIPALIVGLVIVIAFFFLETIVERMKKIWELLSG